MTYCIAEIVLFIMKSGRYHECIKLFNDIITIGVILVSLKYDYNN